MHIHNVNLIIVMLLLALRIWKSGAKTLGGTLPVIVAPCVQCSPALVPLVGLKYIIMNKIKVNKKKPIEMMVVELISTSLVVYMMFTINQMLPDLMKMGASEAYSAATNNLSALTEIVAL